VDQDAGRDHGAVVALGDAPARVAVDPHGGRVATVGSDVAVLLTRERLLELYDARTRRRIGRAGAGIGPTHVAAYAGWLYVTDTRGGALLVLRARPRLELVRRAYLPGAPYGIAVDPCDGRLWVTLTARNELVELPAHGRPHPLRRFATVRQPDAVTVDARSGRVLVAGRAAAVVQIVAP
jgi:DNA-binding beta-propeller fold protein YncE